MADEVFNFSRGSMKQLFENVINNSPTNSAIVVVLLKTAEADDVLNNYSDLATLLAAAGNTEADFTNYVRKLLIDTDLAGSITIDNTNNLMTIDIGTIQWSLAGGTTDNDLVKALFCYDADTTGGTDSDIIPLLHFDFVLTTNSNNIYLNTPNGVWASETYVP